MATVDKKLGFGLMRLPTTDGNPEHIDMEQVCRMVDIFLEGGCTYFDTSYVYHILLILTLLGLLAALD